MEGISQTLAREGQRKRKSTPANDYFGYFKEKQELSKKREGHFLSLKRRKADIEERRVYMDIQLKQKELELRKR